MSSKVSDAGPASLDDATRARVLDLLDQQRRRISGLAERVAAGRRALETSTVVPAWRSPARYQFDLRLADLHQRLDRCSTALRAAQSECDRARSVLLAGPQRP
ncbi:hypothetical protein [Mycetocola sp. 2940]|uniref:hypothetical protein n=1 Tax=Mycetocola sp. 2940 TaxID=3156452 RepID=UPI0033948DFD